MNKSCVIAGLTVIALGACAKGRVDSECGNGILEAEEECDDGNLTPNDGCNAACEVDEGYVCEQGGDATCRAICGDGLIRGVEMCDGTNIGGLTCQSQSLGTGQLACDSETCQLDPSGCSIYSCGNGRLDEGEPCDGPFMGADTCLDLGYDGGSLACTYGCTIDTSGCTLASCGNGILDGVEECDDGSNISGDGCSANCGVEEGWECHGQPSVCETTCGNGQLDTGEQCDGVLLNGETCETVGSFIGGTLLCHPSCAFDVSGCLPIQCGDGIISTGEACDDNNTSSGDGCNVLCNIEAGWECTGEPSSCSRLCGNGQLDTGEQCDGGELGGADCQSQGFDTGSLACTGSCTFNTAGCSYFTCGDGQVTGSEDCDGVNLNGQDCEGLGFVGGTLLCTGNCGFDTQSCIPPECGDGIISPGEQCDDNDTQSGDGCNAACQVENGWICAGEPSVCTLSCGNGNVDPGEDCDDTDLNGQDCQGLGFAGGDLACASCSFDTQDCLAAICPNGTAEQGEECDTSDFKGQDCQSFGFGGGTLQCTGTCTIDTSQCYLCQAEGCATDNGPNGHTCGNAKIVGRLDAASGAQYSGDTSGDGDNDDLSIQDYNGDNCWDARSDNFYRIYLVTGDQLHVLLDPQNSTFDPMMKLYSGIDCAANGYGDLIKCEQERYDGGNEELNYTATADGWYTIVVDGRHATDPDGPYQVTFTLTYGSSGSCCS